jgi:hypothetical protein
MPAEVIETVLADVNCAECGWSHGEPVQKDEARLLADAHNELWHVPVFDDELVP